MPEVSENLGEDEKKLIALHPIFHALSPWAKIGC